MWLQSNKRVVNITFDEYDELQEKFEQLKESDQVKTFYPTPSQIELMEQDPNTWVLFACYLSECGEEPKNAEEKYSRKNLKDFVYRHLQLIESKVG